MPLHFHDIQISNFAELHHYLNLLGTDYIYRGQANHRWNLLSSLERLGNGDPHEHEKNFDREFRRRGHHYISDRSVTAKENVLERLALMQHYNIPTRLLDWTKSPYIAAYFAILDSVKNRSNLTPREAQCKEKEEDREKKTDHGRLNSDSDNSGSPETAEVPDAAIWAIYKPWLAKCREKLTPMILDQLENSEKVDKHALDSARNLTDEKESAIKAFKLLYHNRRYSDLSGVLLLTPDSLNERIMAQQGLFLAPLNLNDSFMKNLESMTDSVPVPQGCFDMPVIKFRLPASFHGEMLRMLTLMNVTGFSLFPDLEGLSEWLRSLPTIGESTRAGRHDLSNFKALLKSNLKADLTVPNEIGALNRVVAVFRNWGANLEHCYITKTEHSIHRWSFDATMSAETVQFCESIVKAVEDVSEAALLERIERCVKSCPRKIDSRGEGSENENQRLVSGLLRHFSREKGKDPVRIVRGLIRRRGTGDRYLALLFDLARIYIKDDLRDLACGPRNQCLGLICGDPEAKPDLPCNPQAGESVRVFMRAKSYKEFSCP